MARQILIIAAILGFIGVALGAFGAHGLEKFANEKQIANYHTGVRYHMYHTLAMMGMAAVAAMLPRRPVQVALWAFTLGIVLFSGSLYLYGLTGKGWLGAITPIGGLTFLVGWASLVAAALKAPREVR